MSDALLSLVRRVLPAASAAREAPLTGGVSASVTRVEVELPSGETRQLVRRSLGPAEERAGIGIAAEFELQRALRATGLPVPEPLCLDDSRERFPDPVLLMEFVAGELATELGPGAVEPMARFLRRLHSLDPEGFELPAREDPRAGALAYLPGASSALREALAGFRWTPARVVLHGDFWPGNVLMAGGQIAAVIDWEDAALGDPLSDLACARLELRCAFGPAAADAFSQSYLDGRSVDPRALALWELYVSAAALPAMGAWGLEPQELEARRATTSAFLRRAAGALAGAGADPGDPALP